MMMQTLRRLVSAVVLGCAVSGAWATVDVSGVTLDETVNVAGVPLKLNGAGFRKRGYFKIDVTALYLQQKATTLDPKNATAWLLLGIALVNTMEFKTVGDKITPVMQPGTVEAYQHAIDLDPNGQIGAQAKDGLASLQAMGVGITTKIGEAPAKSGTKKK